MIEGRVVHKKSNALQITFREGPGEPFAVGVQGAGDGRGSKLATLFGFKNGGSGNHVLTYQDGATLAVASKDSAPSVFARGDGVEVATVHRGETSKAVLAGGSELFHFVPDPDPEQARTPELFRLVVRNPAGEDLGRLDVIRKEGGWTIMRAIDAAWDEYIWWDRAGRALPVPILGTRLMLAEPVSGVERDVLLGACVDITIGLRPYVAAMR